MTEIADLKANLELAGKQWLDLYGNVSSAVQIIDKALASIDDIEAKEVLMDVRNALEPTIAASIATYGWYRQWRLNNIRRRVQR